MGQDQDQAGVSYVFRVDPDHDQPKRRLAGAVAESGGKIHVLADYYGALRGLDGPPGPAARAWAALKRNPYFDVASAEELQDGTRKDLLPSLPMQETGQEDENPAENPHGRPSVFEYHHPALSEPAPIEFKDGEATFYGQALSQQEMARILANVKSGAARIRYNQSAGMEAQVQKSARALEAFEALEKAEPGLAEALAQMRAASKAGHVHPEAFRTLTRQIFGDAMVPGIGNKYAYQDFLSRPRGGVHVALDGNSFKHVNDVHGHEAGDAAIKAMFGAVRRAADKAVGRASSKVFRTGGDEGRVWVPTHEHAAVFARRLREELEALPPIGGTHRLSMSLGFGHSPEAADMASYEAKKAVKAAGYSKGEERTHAYSAMPGREGHVPLSPLKPPLDAPKPEGVAAPPAPAPK